MITMANRAWLVNPNDIVGNSVTGFSLFPMEHPRGTLVAKFSRANGSHASLGASRG
jgi:hypothetical protein